MISLPPSAFLAHGLSLLQHMTLAREGDLRERLLVRQGRGSFQLSGAGHEAIAALAPHVRDGDLVFPAYRDRALMHALGISIEAMARDFLGRAGSSSEGRNLPGHFSSRRHGVFSITSPVGAQCLPAVGAAWAFRMEGKGAVALCHVGDAATRQGEFFEAVAQAVQDGLPIVFVVEDNGFGISTRTAGTTPIDLGLMPSDRTVRIDARDAATVFEAGGEAIRRARAGGGPTVLWCDVDRLDSHTNADDHRTYRPADEVAALVSADPVERLAARLIDAGLLDADGWAGLASRTTEAVRDAYVRVAAEPPADPEGVARELFAPAREAGYPTLTLEGSAETMLQAFNGALRAGLQAEPKALVFGEDVEDPKGGVFGLTKGLSRAFPGRVVNSPLAEATIVGTAVGLAAAGWRPVFELQFVDFLGPAFNQLIAQVSNLRWRTAGDWTCPMVIYAPSGAYLPGGGTWHSQTNEGLLAGMPGLRVAVPSTPEDAAGLLWAAMHDDDPSFLLLPKHLLRATPEGPLPSALEALPWGHARTARAGRDATVIAWGNCVEVALAAADRLAREDGVEVEIVDPRTLVPCDWAALAASVARTGRLVVVQEDTRTGGFGPTVVAELATRPELFGALRAAPVLVSRADVPVPFVATLETAVLPSVADVVEAVRATLAASVAPSADADTATDSGPSGLATLTVPQLGEGLRRVLVTAHLKRVGERVAMDEPLYEVETDKANVAVESSVAGVLVEWCVAAGDEADVHGPIARIAEEGVPAAVVPPVAPKLDPTYEEFPLSDRQRAMNRSALGGRLDVPLPASVGRPLRWSLVEEARARLRRQSPRSRLTEFGAFALAAARATREHPKFRSALVARGETVRRYAHVDLGFAVALPEDELATAVIRSADTLDPGEFAEALVARHREVKAGATQSDGRTTLLISSLAGHDVADASPVLFPPAIATLFLGAPNEGPNGREATMRLAFDHRLINGVGAAEYLRAIETELRALGAE